MNLRSNRTATGHLEGIVVDRRENRPMFPVVAPDPHGLVA